MAQIPVKKNGTPDDLPLQRLRAIEEELAQVPGHWHLPGGSYVPPRIMAVSKTVPVEGILPLLKGGHRLFGENRVQEAEGKYPGLKKQYPDLELHLIGPLQSNKVDQAVELFDVIETLDREKLALALAEKWQGGEGQKVDSEKPFCLRSIMVQVNSGEEAQKHGILPREADAFISWCKNELNLPVKGVMCIPPVQEDAALHFALLRTIAIRNGLCDISMGMSGDYALAAALGSTLVRVGSALFGARN